MIGKLARQRMQLRLSHLTALAVLVALVGAMFVALQSAQADSHPHVAISIGDSDNVVEAGSYSIQLLVMNDGDTDDNTNLTYLRVAETTTDVLVTGAVATIAGTADAPGAAEGTLVVRDGAAGDYTIIAGVAEDAAGTDIISGELKITVGDVGDDVGSAVISFGYKDDSDPAQVALATTTDAVRVMGSADAGDPILLTLTVNNTLDNLTNDGPVRTITLVATGGSLSGAVAVGEEIPAADGAGSLTITDVVAEDGTVTTDNALATIHFTATRATAGSLDVFAIVLGADGSLATSEKVTLTFTAVAGDPAVVSIDDGAAVAQGGASIGFQDGADGVLDSATALDPTPQAATRAILPVSATDDDGIEATLAGTTAITAMVKNADGDDVTVTGIVDTDGNAVTTVAVARYVLDTDVDKTGNQSGIVVTLPADAAAGEYTVTATLGTSTDTAMFTVVGSPANISLDAEPASGAVAGDTITVTATVTDANGEPVAGDTEVTFTTTSVNIAAVGASHTGVKAMGGMASAQYRVLDAGRAVVSAMAGDVTQVITIETAADTPDPEPTRPDPTLTSISVALSEADGLGSTVTATATVEGDEGVDVSFSSSNTNVAAVSGAAMVDSSSGMASATFVVTGYGVAVIRASGGGQVGSATLIVNAPEPDPTPEPMGVDCLSHTSAFSTWTCDESTTLGEIHMSLSSPTAVSVYDRATSAWVSYTGGFGSAPANTPVMQYATIYITE